MIKLVARVVPVIILAAALAVLALPARAQATRTWVSGVGDDTAACSRTAPCKTFAGAISKTAVGGEINVLDPGGFGGVTVTNSITIRADSTEAGVLVSGTNGITINIPTGGVVNINGLDFDGLGSSPSGISVLSATRVHIYKSAIRNFTTGIDVVPTAAPAYVLITDTVLANNTTGVEFKSATIAEPAHGMLDNVTILGNSTSTGVLASGFHAIVTLNNSTIVGNKTGLKESNGQILTFGNNRVIDNTTNGAPSASPTPFE
jgi:hypothetical protein